MTRRRDPEEMEMTELENRLGYRFRDSALLVTALTHSSYANENKKDNAESNERLEFLGDSVLGMTVANYLYRTRADMPEGQMTRLRAELVCEQSLVRVAEKLELGRYIRLGRGEEQGGGRQRRSIIADAVEAVIAAVYLDGGYPEASELVHRFILDPMEDGEQIAAADNKTELQELVQRKSGRVLSYEMTGEYGPDHDKTFESAALLNGKVIGRGKGQTKKEAEQEAAGDALRKLKNEA